MSKIEVELSERVDSEIDRLVRQGEFLDRDQAVEELINQALPAYDTSDEEEDTLDDDGLFNQAVEDQRDPAMRDDEFDDEPTF